MAFEPAARERARGTVAESLLANWNTSGSVRTDLSGVDRQGNHTRIYSKTVSRCGKNKETTKFSNKAEEPE